MLTKREIGEGYDVLPESAFISAKFHKFCVSLARDLRGAIADIGCGPGGLLDVVGEICGEARLYGCDLSFRQCTRAAQRRFRPRVCQADVECLPYKDDAFDYVFMIEVLDHLFSPDQALREVRRVLKPNGCLIVSVPNRDWLRFDKDMVNRRQFQPVDDHWFTFREIQGLLTGAGFALEKVRGGENLYFGGGFSRVLEKVALAIFPRLQRRMKRLILVVRLFRH